MGLVGLVGLVGRSAESGRSGGSALPWVRHRPQPSAHQTHQPTRPTRPTRPTTTGPSLAPRRSPVEARSMIRVDSSSARLLAGASALAAAWFAARRLSRRDYSFRDRTVIITGGTRGLGSGDGAALCRRGCASVARSRARRKSSRKPRTSSRRAEAGSAPSPPIFDAPITSAASSIPWSPRATALTFW